MSKRVRLYDMVNIPAVTLDNKKSQFIKDNMFMPNKNQSLVARIAATHAGIVTRNNGFYLPDKMSQGATSMTTPYPKPVLLHHDSYKDPVGRIIAAEYVNTSGDLIAKDSRIADFFDSKKSFISKLSLIDQLIQDKIFDNPDYQGLGFISAIVNITDPEAIQKIADNRYLTVSIGASTDKAICSICKVDWVEDGPCEHRPGKMYDEKKAFIIAGNLVYEELSFVNSPADPFARVIEVQNSMGETEHTFTLEHDDTDVITDDKAEVYIITDDNMAITLTDTDLQEGIRSLFADIKGNKKEEGADEHPELAEGEEEENEEDETRSASPTGTKKKKKKKSKSCGDSLEEETTVSDTEKDTDKVDSAQADDKQVADQEGTLEISAAIESLESPDASKDDEKKDSEQILQQDEVKQGEVNEEAPPVMEPAKSDPTKTKDEVDSDIKVLESITIDDVKDMEKLTAKIKEAYSFMTDEQVAEAVKEIQSEALRDNFLNELLLTIERVTGQILDRDFNADEFYAVMEQELDQIGSDAKLSTAQRKKLPNSAFCGPSRSFPVPDCAHVTAARRLIGRAKVSAATKANILACVNRKAKALGCSSDEVIVQPDPIVQTDPSVQPEQIITSESTEQDMNKPEFTCETFKTLSEDEFKTIMEFIKAEAEDRKIDLVKIEIKEVKEVVISPELTEELDKVKTEKAELQSQLKALRSELKDVYQDCADLEDAKAELLEFLHKERAQRLCEFKVLTGEIRDQGELEQQLDEEIIKGSDILLENLKNISDKVNLYEIVEKLDNGIDHKPEGIVEDPTLGNIEDDSSEDSSSKKIRDHYGKLMVGEGQRAANRYLDSLRKARLLPSNFKL